MSILYSAAHRALYCQGPLVGRAPYTPHAKWRKSRKLAGSVTCEASTHLKSTSQHISSQPSPGLFTILKLKFIEPIGITVDECSMKQCGSFCSKEDNL